MPAALRLVALAALLLSARAGAAEGTLSAGAEPAPATGDEAIARLRFAWRAPLRARVTYRRTRLRPGAPPSVFTARYETRVEPGVDGLRIATRGTSWRGDLPFPRALAREAIRASEQVVQRVGADGEFAGLEGVEAMRPVLARVFEEAKVPPDAAERALPLAEAALRAEAEELWNLAVGFWTGADLKVGETYALQSEAELPHLPGTRAPQAVEFAVRRRVPCAAGERIRRCVEATLRSTPDAAALARAAEPLLARLLPAGTEDLDDARRAVSAGSELLLVTEPGTLLPRRVVWTKTVRLGADDAVPARAELVDRSEYDYRYLPPEPPRPPRAKRRAPRPTPPPAGPAPPPASSSAPSPAAAAAPAVNPG